MQVLNVPTADTEVTDHSIQDPSALISEMVTGEFDGNTVRAAEVTFRPGERTKFHAHEGVQVLYGTGGEGIVATREGERTVSEGDLVVFPPGEEHWHGNTDGADEAFSHVFFLAEPTDAEPRILDAP